MPLYRIYSLDAAGQVVTGESVYCLDDAAATEMASVIFEHQTMFEVWEGIRRVTHVERQPDGVMRPGRRSA